MRGILAVIASVAVGMAAPLLVGQAVDTFRRAPAMGTLVAYGALLVAVALVRGIFTYLQRMTLVSMSRDIENDLRDDLFRHLERLPQTFYHDHPTGDLMARATNDLQAVRMLCGPAIMYSANTVFTAAGSLAFMFAIHPRLSLLALAPMPLVAIATQVFGQRIHVLFEGVQETFSDLSTRVQENLAGLRVVRAYAREAWEESLFARRNDEYVARNRRLILWTSAFHPLLQVLVGVGFVAVLWYGGRLVSGDAITIGEFVTFNFFLAKLIWPMVAIGWVINLVQRGSASLGRIRRVMDIEPAIRDVEPLVRPQRIAGEVLFRDLSFAYGEGQPPALAAVELAVRPGQTVALVGHTGAGKSTLLSLIPRLLDPPPGSLFLDGLPIHQIPLQQLRAAIAMVPQETFLFSVTVAANIALGRPDAGREQV
ncbi:MAG TPA: ABC transporter transmembrane domain-containing protein, partial [Thermoanaerobaculia bacterium]|nr:ABC transporter transmembrane domain-containing protein [Thermoanaerobaculia bacterium]